MIDSTQYRLLSIFSRQLWTIVRARKSLIHGPSAVVMSSIRWRHCRLHCQFAICCKFSADSCPLIYVSCCLMTLGHFLIFLADICGWRGISYYLVLWPSNLVWVGRGGWFGLQKGHNFRIYNCFNLLLFPRHMIWKALKIFLQLFIDFLVDL